MQDFNDYVNNGGKGNNSKKEGQSLNGNLADLVSSIAGKYNGKNQTELMRAIYEQAKAGKMNGTLKNSDIDNFVSMLSPMLDNSQKKILLKIATELKKI